jgi:hypothetical protein
MTTVTIDRAVLEQALAALQTFMLHADDDCGGSECGECAENRIVWDVIKTIHEALNAPSNVEPLSNVNGQAQTLDAQPKPVFVLWQHGETGRTTCLPPDHFLETGTGWFCVGPLYLAPPQPAKREWVSLTDDEIDTLSVENHYSDYVFIRAIEAALKERNHE